MAGEGSNMEAQKVVGELELPRGRVFRLVEGDLLSERVDAIVNAANGHLAHGGGVAALISRAAGAALDEEGRAHVRVSGPVPTGEAVVTTAGALGYEGVVHAVGPVQGEGDEEAKLEGAIAAALSRASERGWRSISFPAVSSGIFAVPHATCARAYVRGVRRHFADHPDSSLEEVRLCLLSGSPLVGLVAEEMQATG
jgi:O-acetyl-ADP-ribose deacetylase (regulator of RNase III)